MASYCYNICYQITAKSSLRAAVDTFLEGVSFLHFIIVVVGFSLLSYFSPILVPSNL